VTTAPTASTTLASETAAPAPTSGPTSSAALIPDGSYKAASMQVADVIALINADTKLSAAQKTDIIESAFVIKGHTTFAVSLDLHGGQWTETQFVDGVGEVGQRATYAFPDQHTVVIEEQCCGISAFQVTLGERSFTLKVASTQGPTDEEGALIGRILFESSPFTLAH
jgi:hypothetical protein